MRWLRWLTWLVVGLWFVFCLVTIDYNGPFFDEAIYITAGQRTLEGFGYSDGYMGWFAGSLLWPALAGIGFAAAGLVGTRVVALLLTTIALAAVVQAAANLFGPRAAFWTALAFALNGPLLALARLGVYDVPALVAVAVAFWAITELAKSDRRIWLAVAAAAFMVGFFSKYPVGLMLLPLLGVLFVLRRDKALLDTGIWGFVSLAVLLAFLLPAREQVAALVAWQTANRPSFGVTREMILAGILYAVAVPAVLAAGGWGVAWSRAAPRTSARSAGAAHAASLQGTAAPAEVERGRAPAPGNAAKGALLLTGARWRGLAALLLLNLALWPAYHLLSGNPVGVNKHLVFSFALAYPLVGLALSALWSGGKALPGRDWEAPAPPGPALADGAYALGGGVRLRSAQPGRPSRRILPRLAAAAIILTMGAYAAIQLNQSDNAWPDTRPAADYLAAHVRPGEQLLINESWPYTMVLYDQGRIATPWDVYDYYRITHGEGAVDICAYDWFVDTQGSYAWPQAVREAVESCGTYRQVLTTTSYVIALGADWNYVRYPVQTIVWQREGGTP